ncbi:MAG: penicillin-binding protein 2 [Cardiobacteriaceae bacterium]|nr:penicillin-binding protein 2 [Cardiobacteriaceae bacterium]
MKRPVGDALSGQQEGDLEAAQRVSFSRRVALAGAGVLAGLLTLFGRMFYLQVEKHDFYRTRSQSNRVRIKALIPERGQIYDRHGQALTENILRYRVVVNPAQLQDTQQALDEFAAIIPLSEEERAEFMKRLGQTRRYENAILKEGIDEQSHYRLSVMLYRLPGFEIEPYHERYYPLGILTAHVLGYTNRINDKDLETLDEADYRGLQTIGRAGIERQYEARLRGKPGYQQVETDANGNLVRLLEEVPARRGQDIHLSLDAELQRFIYEAMGDYRGSCVVLEPESGEVLALVSKPGYDANLFTRGISRRQYQRLLEDPHGPLYDRALKGRYPPGSVVKPMMSLAAYHYGIFNTQTTVHCPGHYVIDGQGGRRFHCWNRRGHGSMNADHAIAESCDVYYYQLGHRLGIERMSEYAAHFSLGRLTGIDMPEEGSGIMPTRAWKEKRFKRPWYIGDTINASIGQGFVTMTPIQLAYMTTLIARDGRPFTPRLLRRVYDPQSEKFLHPVTDGTQTPLDVHHPENWASVRQAMVNVVHSAYGTGRKIAPSRYRMAGKSGTVQVISFQNDRRLTQEELAEEHRDNAMFIAFAPAQAPKVAVAIVVERGGSGSSTAGPIVRDICDYYLDKEGLI